MTQNTQFNNYDEFKAAIVALGEDNVLMFKLTPMLASEILAHDPVNREIRPGNLAKLEREMREGAWQTMKAPPMRFFNDGRLADGQHRCRAAVNTDVTITALAGIIDNTIGLDEGASRSLVDYLILDHGLAKPKAAIVAAVVSALCESKAPNNRELLKTFNGDQAFILETATKAMDLVADKTATFTRIFKPVWLAVWRARSIKRKGEEQPFVDQFMEDVVNDGVTAPQGSPRRALAELIHKQMTDGHRESSLTNKKATEWFYKALDSIHEGKVRNILTVRPRRRPRQQKAAAPAA